MAGMNFDGTIDSERVYTAKQVMIILDISSDQLDDYWKAGLRFFRKSRQQPRLTTGAEIHRFIERNFQSWPSEGDDGPEAAATPA